MTDQDLPTLLAELDAKSRQAQAEMLSRPPYYGPGTMALVNAYPTLRAEIERLQAWKAEALAVEAQWNVQAVGRAIAAPLGADIRPLILTAIEQLQRRNNELNYEQQECSQVCTGLEIERDALCALVAQQREALEGLWFARPDGSLCWDSIRCVTVCDEHTREVLSVSHSRACLKARAVLAQEVPS